jgi:hypothetical protein
MPFHPVFLVSGRIEIQTRHMQNLEKSITDLDQFGGRSAQTATPEHSILGCK